MSTRAITIAEEEARCAFENKFMKKGGAAYDPKVCYFMWMGIPCTPKCCNGDTYCGGLGRSGLACGKGGSA
jgi:hypothetical protein